MARINPIPQNGYCSKNRFYLYLLTCAIVLIGYLFVYKIGLNNAVVRTREFLVPNIGINQRIIPLGSITNEKNTTPEITDELLETLLVNDESNNTDIPEQPKEAFVTFCNNETMYLALFKVLLDSVHAFSTRPIIAFGIDVDLDLDVKQYPRLIKRRIKQSDCGPSVYFCKIYAIVKSNVDYGVLMETDDVVNYNVDMLFEVLHVWPYPVPLSPRHPDDPNIYADFMQQHNVSKRKTPYIHAHMIWTYRALPFLKRLYFLLRRGHFKGANFDETGLNIMLWKAGANHTLCKYDPFFIYSEAYEKWPVVVNCKKYCYTVFLTLHGCKHAQHSAELLTRLKEHVGKPAKQAPGIGGMMHINDTSFSCYEPDSKQSPIHPLLCEHSL